MHFTKLVLTTMILGSTQISAAPLHWVLDGVTFQDESTATGSFDYDADTNEYSNIAISTRENEYGDELPSNFISATTWRTVPDASLSDLTGQPNLSLWFDSPLTDSGGSVSIDIRPQSREGTCLDADCSSTSGGRDVTSGNVVEMPNPKPSPSMPNPKPSPTMPNPKPSPTMPNPKPSPTMPNPKPSPTMPNPKPSPSMPNPKPSPTMPNPKPSPGSMTKSSRGSMTKSSRGSMTKSSTSKGKGGKGKSSRSFPL